MARSTVRHFVADIQSCRMAQAQSTSAAEIRSQEVFLGEYGQADRQLADRERQRAR